MVETTTTASHQAEFTEIFEAHHDRAYRLACLLSGDRDVAEEATAEAFSRTFERWLRGGIEDVGAYVRAAVVNQVRAAFRRGGRRERDAVWVMERTSRPTAFEDRIADHELVHQLLMQLPLRQRAAIVLRFYEDLTEADTAAALGTRVGTVKAQVSRGLARLRQMLEDEHPEPPREDSR